MIQTRKMLDKMTCMGCGKDHAHELFLHSRCHVNSPTWCSYSDGVLTVTCATCKKVVVKIAVATYA